jgi:hypothetical protein
VNIPDYDRRLDPFTTREAAEKCMMEDVVKQSVSYSESSRDARMGYLTGQIAGRDANISRSLSHHQRKEYIFGPSDFRRLRPHEAIFKGFDGERVIGPAKIYLKPYWKERGISYFEEEGR